QARNLFALARGLLLALLPEAWTGKQHDENQGSAALRLREQAHHALSLRRLQRAEQRSGLTRRIFRLDRLLDRSLWPDHEREPARVTILLRFARAIGEPDSPVDVAQQRKRVAELFRERLVLLRRVERDSEHDSSLGFEVADSITEPASLLRSAGRVRLGIEPQHDALALEVGELHELAVLVRHFERGSRAADRGHHSGLLYVKEAKKTFEHEDTVAGSTSTPGCAARIRRARARGAPLVA